MTIVHPDLAEAIEVEILRAIKLVKDAGAVPCRASELGAQDHLLRRKVEGGREGMQFDRKSGRLGMRLISSFARQLQGDLQVLRKDPGTPFVLKFPLSL